MMLVVLLLMTSISATVVGVVLGDQFEDLFLPRVSISPSTVLAGAGALGVFAHKGADATGLEEGLAAECRATRFDDVAVGCTLEHTAQGADSDLVEQTVPL